MIDRAILTLALPDSVHEKTVRKAYTRFNELRAQFNDASREVTSREAAVKEAERLDREAFGKALADGKPDPGATAVVEAKVAVEDAKRRRDALEHAVGIAHREVVTAVTKTRDTWEAELEAEFKEAAERYEESVADLGDAHATFADVITTLDWLDRFANGEIRRKKAGAAKLHDLPRLIQRNGDPYSFDAVFNALRDLGDLDRLAGPR